MTRPSTTESRSIPPNEPVEPTQSRWRLVAGMFTAFLLYQAITIAQSVTPLVTPQLVPFDENPPAEAPENTPQLGFTPSPDAPTDPTADFTDTPGAFTNNAPSPAFTPLDIESALPNLSEDPASSEPFPDENDSWTRGETNGSIAPMLSEFALVDSFSTGWARDVADGRDAIFPGAGWTGPIREGLTLSLSLSGSYDTNPSQGIRSNNRSSGGDFLMTLGGGINYRSTASTWTYGVSYSGGYSWFFDSSDLGGYNQRASASLHYDSGPLSATLTLGVDYGSGANRFANAVVDEIRISSNLSARYNYSPKTSFTGAISKRFSDASGGRDTDSFDLSTAALWKYSPLTEFGPGIRYTRRGGDNNQRRETLGPTLTVNYQLAQKVSLNSRVGMDFVRFSDGDSGDPALSTSIGLNYRATSYWGLNLTLLRDVEAALDPNRDFEETTALRFGYNRQIRRASWNAGVGLENRSAKNSNPNVQSRGDRNYLTLDSSIGMPIFADTTSASLFTRYRRQTGDSNGSWDSLQFGFSISRNF